MDLSYGAEAESFRGEVSTFLKQALQPGERRGAALAAFIKDFRRAALPRPHRRSRNGAPSRPLGYSGRMARAGAGRAAGRDVAPGVARIMEPESERGPDHGRGQITKAHLHHGAGSGLGIELLIRQFDRKFVPPRGSLGK